MHSAWGQDQDLGGLRLSRCGTRHAASSSACAWCADSILPQAGDVTLASMGTGSHSDACCILGCWMELFCRRGLAVCTPI